MELALAEIPTKVNRKGLITVKEFPEGLSLALPYPEKSGHAQVVFVPIKGITTNKVVNVSGDYTPF